MLFARAAAVLPLLAATASAQLIKIPFLNIGLLQPVRYPLLPRSQLACGLTDLETSSSLRQGALVTVDTIINLFDPGAGEKEWSLTC